MISKLNSGRLRSALILPALVMLMGTFGCGGGGGGAQRISDSVQPATSQTPPPMVVSVTPGSGYYVSVEASVALESATLFFADGGNESHALQGNSEDFTSALDAPLSYLKVTGKNGDYWFFDRGGSWLPDGYKPDFSFGAENGKGTSLISVVDTTLTVVSSDTMCQVKVGYADNSIQTFYTYSVAESLMLAQSRPNVEAIMVKIMADGSKWYFDRYGNPLPLNSKWYQDLD